VDGRQQSMAHSVPNNVFYIPTSEYVRAMVLQANGSAEHRACVQIWTFCWLLELQAVVHAYTTAHAYRLSRSERVSAPACLSPQIRPGGIISHAGSKNKTCTQQLVSAGNACAWVI
jgi:hypothetical protein